MSSDPSLLLRMTNRKESPFEGGKGDVLLAMETVVFEAMQSQHPPCPLHKGEIKKLKTHNSKLLNMENKQLWSKILNILITVLTAVATTFGVTSCIGL